MPQLDRLLSVMVSNRAEALRLVENELASLVKDGATVPLTKQALGATQLLGLLREIAPPDALRRLDEGTSAEFEYRSNDGVFSARATNEGGKWTAAITAGVNGGTPVAMPAIPSGAGRPTPSVAASRVVHAPSPVATPIATVAPVATPASAPAATPIVKVGEDSTARMAMDNLLRQLVEQGGSDLHLRCSEPPILRRHGEMVRLPDEPPLDDATLMRMLTVIMPERNRTEYAETNDTDFAYEIAGLARFRANAFRERKGAGAVLRVIPAKVVSAEELGITTEVQALCQLTKGLVLVTGPTGSGKSTTLCALIDLINRTRTDHVITIEDPIEFVHQNKRCVITQRQVGVHTGSFKHALRAALREDPDIVLVGELRDLETASIAIETAETGHLVFGTLHTTTAPSTIDRLVDQFPADRQEQIRVMLSESLKGVISQVLCKKIGGGRVAAREILLSTNAISNLIREAKTFQITSVMQTSRRGGMCTLNDALIELVDAGQVEPKEAYMKATDKSGFSQALRSRGHDTSFVDGESATGHPSKPENGVGSKGASPRAAYTAKR
jgi:twitching motility protein PilT